LPHPSGEIERRDRTRIERRANRLVHHLVYDRYATGNHKWQQKNTKLSNLVPVYPVVAQVVKKALPVEYQKHRYERNKRT
jgi:hypothetical protein